MKENLKQSEIDFICNIHDPICIKETLFPENLKACHTWIEEDCKLIQVYRHLTQNYRLRPQW